MKYWLSYCFHHQKFTLPLRTQYWEADLEFIQDEMWNVVTSRDSDFLDGFCPYDSFLDNLKVQPKGYLEDPLKTTKNEFLDYLESEFDPWIEVLVEEYDQISVLQKIPAKKIYIDLYWAVSNGEEELMVANVTERVVKPFLDNGKWHVGLENGKGKNPIPVLSFGLPNQPREASWTLTSDDYDKLEKWRFALEEPTVYGNWDFFIEIVTMPNFMKWILGEFAKDAPDVSEVMHKCPLDLLSAFENHTLAEDLVALCKQQK